MKRISNKIYQIEENELKIEEVSLNFNGEESTVKIKITL